MKKNKRQEAKHLFRTSLMELKSTQTVVFCGLMGAMGAVLKLVISIGIGNYLRIGVDWIPSRIVDFMFGPAVGALFGGVMDIVKHFVKPMGAFDFRFTFVPMAAGLVYGFLLYKKPVRLWRVFAGKLFVTVVLNLGVNTYLISTNIGKAYLAILPTRLIKNLIALPIETAMMFFVLTTVARISEKMRK